MTASLLLYSKPITKLANKKCRKRYIHYNNFSTPNGNFPFSIIPSKGLLSYYSPTLPSTGICYANVRRHQTPLAQTDLLNPIAFRKFQRAEIEYFISSFVVCSPHLPLFAVLIVRKFNPTAKPEFTIKKIQIIHISSFSLLSCCIVHLYLPELLVM